MDCVFGVVLKKASPSRFFLTLSSRVLPLDLCPFWVNFCEKLQKLCVWIYFFACGCPVVPAPFVEESLFAPLHCLCTFVKGQLTIFMQVYFWALYSVHQYSTVFLIYFIYLFWVFVAVCELSLVAASRAYSSLRCTCFSLRWLLLWNTGSRCTGFSSYGVWAQ